VTWPFDQLLEVWNLKRQDKAFPPVHPTAALVNRMADEPEADMREVPAIVYDKLALKAVEMAISELGLAEDGKNGGPNVARWIAPAKPPANYCAGGCGYAYEAAAREMGIPLPFQRSLLAKTIGKNVATVGRRFNSPRDAQPGDLLVLHRDRDQPWSGHVELVERVAGDALHTIAFNSGPKVRRRVHPLPIPRLAFLASLRR
jgi:hypothetical protein